ncbi:hypothetical protein JL722_5459 [Aureococcus anophagefferens]|nr:hypothetical protein JL722_5459 [Aureococcus anophagefferens]
MGGAASAQAQAPPHMETPAPPFPPARLAEKGPPVGGLRSMKRLRRLLYIKAYNAKPEGTTIDELFRRYRRVNAAGVGVLAREDIKAAIGLTAPWFDELLAHYTCGALDEVGFDLFVDFLATGALPPAPPAAAPAAAAKLPAGALAPASPSRAAAPASPSKRRRRRSPGAPQDAARVAGRARAAGAARRSPFAPAPPSPSSLPPLETAAAPAPAKSLFREPVAEAPSPVVAEAPSPVVAEAPSPVVAASPSAAPVRVATLDELEPVDECALAVLPGDAVIAAGDHLKFRRPGPAKPLWRKREVVVLQERIVQYTTVDVSGAVQELVETERSSTEVVHMECKETGEFAHRETSEYEQLETFNGQAVAENRGNEEYYHLKSAEDEVEFMESNNMPNRAGAPGDAPPGTPGGAPGGRPHSAGTPHSRTPHGAPSPASYDAMPEGWNPPPVDVPGVAVDASGQAVCADTGLPLSPEDFDIFQRAAFAQREAYAAYAAEQYAQQQAYARQQSGDFSASPPDAASPDAPTRRSSTRSSGPTRASSRATSARRRPTRRARAAPRPTRGPFPARPASPASRPARRRRESAEFGFGGDEPPRFAGDLDDDDLELDRALDGGSPDGRDRQRRGDDGRAELPQHHGAAGQGTVGDLPPPSPRFRATAAPAPLSTPVDADLD